jgi:SOS-response transcriptional repressor LexA/DNA-binding XRE family transcriptional regulator
VLDETQKQLLAATGLLLRLLRLSSGLEQERMAARLSVSQPTISRWEKGRGGPDAKQLTDWLMLCQVALRAAPENGGNEAAAAPAVSAAQLNAAMRVLFAVYAPEAPGAGLEHTPDGLHGELRRLTQELLLGQPQPGDGQAGGGPALSLIERQPQRAPTLIPLYADIAAGLGEVQDARAAPREALEVPLQVLNADPDAYAMRVRGDSMAPLLLDGDAVIVSPAALPEDGCLVAAYVEPDGDVVKHFEWVRPAAPAAAGTTPEALLRPVNPSYPVIRIGGELGRTARIWGRVVLLLREL